MSPTSYRFGPFSLDRAERLLYCDGQAVALTPRAVDTLLALVERHGRLVTKDELLREVWHDTFVEENNLAQHISMVRRALAQGGGGETFIETIPKRGYRFVAPVVEDGDAPATVAAPTPVDPPAPAALAQSAPAAPWRTRAAAAAILVLLASVVWIGYTRARPDAASAADEIPKNDAAGPGAILRIVVLPFLTLGAGTEDYLAAGTTEEVTSRLATLSGLGVVSSTSAREYDRRGRTVRRIGADLNATFIVEGSVRWDGREAERVRIIPKLIRVADDVTIWTHQYEAPLEELAVVHADIAQQVAGALRVGIESSEQGVTSVRGTGDTEAYLSYLRGSAAFQQSWSDTSLQAVARREMESAVARDPEFALAWSWLAHVLATQYNVGAERTPATREAAHRAARRAVALAPQLPEAHLGLARVLMLDRDYDAALASLETARALRPHWPELLRVAAFTQQRRGQWAAALDLHLRAFELDPVSSGDLVAVQYLHLRDYATARRYNAVSMAAERSAAIVPGAWIEFSESGDVSGARALLEPALSARTPPDARVRGLLARLEWFDGNYERALELIRGMDAAGTWWAANFRMPAAIAMAQVYDSLGQRERAEQSYASALADLERRGRTNPGDYQVEAAIGLASAGLGRADEAVRHGRRAVELLPVTKDGVEGPVYVYALAAIHARLGQHAEAFEVLERLFRGPGFYNEMWLARDPWFATLRAEPRYAEHVARWRQQKGDALIDRDKRSIALHEYPLRIRRDVVTASGHAKLTPPTPRPPDPLTPERGSARGRRGGPEPAGRQPRQLQSAAGDRVPAARVSPFPPSATRRGQT